MAIQTLVIFDLETTGIPARESKITEICLLAVSRRDIEHADGKNLPPMDKLSFLCNPEKVIQSRAAQVTGLTNQILKDKPVFKNNIECINCFLDKQQKPVCLVAHNGNVYDFKILQAEYSRANKTLPSDLVCIDSLKVFRNILKEPVKISTETMKDDSAISLDESDRAVEDVSWSELSMEETQEINDLLDQFSNLSTTSNHKKNKENRNINTPKQEKPPKQDKTPKQDETIVKKTSPKQGKTSQIAQKVSYTLESIYKRLVNKEITNAHRAEADCIMLLQCIVAKQKEFLQFADNNNNLLTSIKQ